MEQPVARNIMHPDVSSIVIILRLIVSSYLFLGKFYHAILTWTFPEPFIVLTFLRRLAVAS